MEVDFKYLDKMIRNLNILHDIDPNFTLIDHTDAKQRFFGFFMPF